MSTKETKLKMLPQVFQNINFNYFCQLTRTIVKPRIELIVDAPNCEACDEALKHLEDIDDDADAVGVRMVKTEDRDFIKMYGLEHFPTVVYFEKDNPHIYNGQKMFLFSEMII